MIKEFCEEGLRLAENEIYVEHLAGNIVKMEHWKGEACAYRAVLNALPSDNKLQAAIAVLKEIDDYLSPNPKNYMGCDSILHKKVKVVLLQAAM